MLILLKIRKSKFPSKSKIFKKMWEAKLNQSRALAQPSSNEIVGASGSSAAANQHQAENAAARSHHHHHHQQHTASASSNPPSSGGSGNMRLPISTSAPTSKEVAHQLITRNVMSAQQATSAAAISSSRSQTSSPSNNDIKPSIAQIMDPSTRAAFQVHIFDNLTSP